MKHYCTLTDAGYLTRFLALYESMRLHCKPFALHVLALDAGAEQKLIGLPHLTVTSLSAVETDQLRQAKANRSYVEYAWTLKPSFMRATLNELEIPGVAHVDADMLFFGDPSPVFEEIGDAPVAVAPHRYSPRCWPRTESPGVYNGGFVYVARSGMDFLDWWAEKCVEWCYWHYEDDDKYCDQKYLDDAPERWGAHALQHKGAHLAPWNQEQYGYELRGRDIYVDGEPLLWYHFHKGLEPGYVLHPFVKEFIYGAYREALEHVKRGMDQC